MTSSPPPPGEDGAGQAAGQGSCRWSQPAGRRGHSAPRGPPGAHPGSRWPAPHNHSGGKKRKCKISNNQLHRFSNDANDSTGIKAHLNHVANFGCISLGGADAGPASWSARAAPSAARMAPCPRSLAGPRTPPPQVAGRCGSPARKGRHMCMQRGGKCCGIQTTPGRCPPHPVSPRVREPLFCFWTLGPPLVH